MKSRFIHALCGVVVAASVRYLLPVEDPHGYLLPVLLGAFGGWMADWLGQRAGLYRTDQHASFVMSALGAMALMLVYGVVGWGFRRR